jgi:hypothetical protein
MFSFVGSAFNSVLDTVVDLVFPIEGFQIDWLEHEEV